MTTVELATPAAIAAVCQRPLSPAVPPSCVHSQCNSAASGCEAGLSNVEPQARTSIAAEPNHRRATAAAATASDLPGGLIVQAGDGVGDTLVITGTSEPDTIFVDQGHADVNGLQMAFTGVERVVIRGTDAGDTIEVADEVDFDVDVRDEFDNEPPRDGRHQLAQRRTNERQTRASNQNGPNETPENADAEPDAMNNVLDSFFASGDLNRLLSMRNDQRRQ